MSNKEQPLPNYKKSTPEASVEEIREYLNNVPITESRKKIQQSTDYKNTSTFLRTYGGAEKFEARYENAPQFHNKMRKEGFFMNDYQKVSLFRDGKIDLNGPHIVLPVEGHELEISKYYSNWEIDYKKFFKSLENEAH